MTAIEDMMYSGLLGMVGGNAMWLGLLLFGGLAGLVFVLPVRGDVKMMVLIPAAMLSAVAIDFLRLPIFILGVAIIMFAALKFMNH